VILNPPTAYERMASLPIPPQIPGSSDIIPGSVAKIPGSPSREFFHNNMIPL